MIQTRLEFRRGPYIGERAAWWIRPGVVAVGTIVDIRDVAVKGAEAPEPAIAIATLGWPKLAWVPLGQYAEIRDGVWRACSHPRGYNAAGVCFDCSISPAPGDFAGMPVAVDLDQELYVAIHRYLTDQPQGTTIDDEVGVAIVRLAAALDDRKRAKHAPNTGTESVPETSLNEKSALSGAVNPTKSPSKQEPQVGIEPTTA